MNTLLSARGTLKVRQKRGYILHKPLAGCFPEHLKHCSNHMWSQNFSRPKLCHASGVDFPDNMGQAILGGVNVAEISCLCKVLSIQISDKRGCKIAGAEQEL